MSNGNKIFLKMSDFTLVGPLKHPPAETIERKAQMKMWMIVDYFQWGARRVGATSSNAGDTGGGTASYFDIPFSKSTCLATAQMMNYCSSGKMIQKAEFMIYSDDKASNMAVDECAKKLTLENVYVTGVDVGNDGTDRITLAYSKWQWNIHGKVVAGKAKVG